MNPNESETRPERESHNHPEQEPESSGTGQPIAGSDTTRQNPYEMAALLDSDLSDKDVQEFVRTSRELLEKHGAVDLGEPKVERRALAFPLRNKTEGYYVFVNFNAPPTLPEAMRTELRHYENLLRLAFVRKPEPEPPAEEESAPEEPPAQEAQDG